MSEKPHTDTTKALKQHDLPIYLKFEHIKKIYGDEYNVFYVREQFCGKFCRDTSEVMDKLKDIAS